MVLRLRAIVSELFFFQKIVDGVEYADSSLLLTALNQTRKTGFDTSKYDRNIVAEHCILKWPVESLGEPPEAL